MDLYLPNSMEFIIPFTDVYEYLKYLLEEMPNNDYLQHPEVLDKYLPWSAELPEQCRLKTKHIKCLNR